MSVGDVLFFDLDGCLVDSTRPITTCMDRALRELGVPSPPSEELVRFIGPPLAESFTILVTDAGADPGLVPELVERYRAAYREESLRSTEVVPGVEEALARLAGDADLAVVTSKPGAFAVPILETLGLAGWFLAVYAPDTDLRGEPKQATLQRALVEVAQAASPSRAVMIGDREHDVLAGRACGTRTVGVTWGAGDRAELEGAGADRVVTTPAELVDVLGSWGGATD